MMLLSVSTPTSQAQSSSGQLPPMPPPTSSSTTATTATTSVSQHERPPREFSQGACSSIHSASITGIQEIDVPSEEDQYIPHQSLLAAMFTPKSPSAATQHSSCSSTTDPSGPQDAVDVPGRLSITTVFSSTDSRRSSVLPRLGSSRLPTPNGNSNPTLGGFASAGSGSGSAFSLAGDPAALVSSGRTSRHSSNTTPHRRHSPPSHSHQQATTTTTTTTTSNNTSSVLSASVTPTAGDRPSHPAFTHQGHALVQFTSLQMPNNPVTPGSTPGAGILSPMNMSSATNSNSLSGSAHRKLATVVVEGGPLGTLKSISIEDMSRHSSVCSAMDPPLMMLGGETPQVRSTSTNHVWSGNSSLTNLGGEGMSWRSFPSRAGSSSSLVGGGGGGNNVQCTFPSVPFSGKLFAHDPAHNGQMVESLPANPQTLACLQSVEKAMSAVATAAPPEHRDGAEPTILSGPAPKSLFSFPADEAEDVDGSLARVSLFYTTMCKSFC